MDDESTVADAPEKVSDQRQGTAEGENTDLATKALVLRWMDRITKAKEHWKEPFKQMKADADMAALGGEKEWVESGRYTVPIISQHINTSVSRLYAKNPRVVAERKRRLMYTLWDGESESLQAAMEMAMAGDPMSAQIVQEVLAVKQHNLMYDRLGETLAILFEYYMNEQAANFKQQLKAAVRRTKTVGAAYVKIGFQRILEPQPEITARINDTRSKIAALETILHKVAEEEVDTQAAEMTELRTLMADLERRENLVVREGLVFDFPRAAEIIIDPACRHLKSFSGATWVAQEYEMSRDTILETYKVDVKNRFRHYRADGKTYDAVVDDGVECRARVYEIYDRQLQQMLVICEGYDDFLKAPSEPDLKIDRFWPWFPIVFNEVEHDTILFPPSDTARARHIQNEYNRSREGLRQHRIASRPYWVEGGTLEEEEKKKLANHADHEVITMPSLSSGEKVLDRLQPGPTAPIDPNLYEVEMHYNDLLRVTGAQEANLGGMSGGTATESSIAENSRGISDNSSVDDLDEMLSELAHAGGQILLTEMTKESVIEIVGPGAVWPDTPQTREEVSKDIYLSIKAGSSGRPNQAAESANIERAAPIMLQVPGINPKALADRFAKVLDFEPEELYASGLPSITAMNAMMAKMGAGAGGEPTGDPDSDPNQQGQEGSQNAPNPQTNEPGPQPAYPAPMAI